MFSKPVHLVLEGAELPLNMSVLYRYMFNLKRFCHSLLFFNIVKLLSICPILTISFMVTTQLRRSTLVISHTFMEKYLIEVTKIE